jgi:hypothetical protein
VFFELLRFLMISKGSWVALATCSAESHIASKLMNGIGGSCDYERNGYISIFTLHSSLPKGYAVIFGNEVKGVKQNIVDMSDGCLEIPQFGTKHSLNVSVTAGIVVWEFAKLLKL